MTAKQVEKQKAYPGYREEILRIWRRWTVLVVLGVLAPAFASAQVTTGDVLGTVTDQTGAAIPGAKVTLSNLGTGVTQTVQSNGAGDYIFTLLQPGSYSVQIEAPTFKKVVYANVPLAAGDRLREDGKMETGAVEETVQVDATPPLLQTDSSAVSSVVTQESVQDLPLNGRNFINLVTIQAGVNQGPPNAISSGTRPDDRRQTSTVSANGQSDLFNNEMIDGMDNNEREQGFIGVRPSIDAIAEVKIDTNSFTADTGRDAGAVVNIITKAGTNAYHGSAYEFFRNDIFDATSYGFGNKLPKTEYRQNQFGGSIGGPIRKNKTFFFADAEDNRIIQGLPTTLYTVPTCRERGLASDCKTPSGIYDFTDNGGTAVSAAKTNAVGLNYLGLYPLPNAGGAGAVANNYASGPNQTQYAFSTDGRIDQNFNNGDRLFARYSYNDVSTATPGAFPDVSEANLTISPGGVPFGFAGPSITKAQNVQISYTHLFSPNLIMDLKTGYTRIVIDSESLNYGKNVSSALGVVNANTPDAIQTTGLTPLAISGGYAAPGDSPFLPILDRNNTFQYMGAVIYTHGKHDLKMGAQFTRRQLNYFQQQFGLGYVIFAGLSGNAIEDLVLGNPLGYIRKNQLIEPGYRVSEYGTYIQDNWRVTHSLTLNLGLRWDVYGALTEAHNRYDNFDYPTLTIIPGSQSPHIGIDTNYKNFQPRVGFAQSVGTHTVVHGGFGISSYPIAIQNQIQVANPPFSYSNTCIPCFGRFTWPVLPIPTMGSITNLTGNLTYNAKNFNTLYVNQFNLMVQREVAGNTFTIGGIGELGRHLPFQGNINAPNPTGPYPNDSVDGPPRTAFLTAAALPNVGPVSVNAPWATNNYYALQVIYERRFAKGLGFNANYTWAHGLGDAGVGTAVGLIPTDVRADYGNSGVDVRNRFAANWSYQLPFGEHASGAKALLIKGWQSNFLMFWQSGQPFGVTDGWTNVNGSAQINLPTITSDRPDLIAPGKYKTKPSPSLSNWLNPAAFTPQPAGTLGDERNNPFHGPHTRRADLSLFKNIDVTEGLTAQFRAEVFNISNTPNFLPPNANITSWQTPGGVPIPNGSKPGLLPGDVATNGGGFGAITSTVPNLNPRQFQFALKLLF
jgi:hypothetical protein